jgi:hypothetical protein
MVTNNGRSVSEFLFTHFASRRAPKDVIRNSGWETMVCTTGGDLTYKGTVVSPTN